MKIVHCHLLMFAVVVVCLHGISRRMVDAAKRKRASSRQASNTDDNEAHINRTLGEWQALSPPALMLILNQHHLTSTGSTANIALRLFQHFQSLPPTAADQILNLTNDNQSDPLIHHTISNPTIRSPMHAFPISCSSTHTLTSSTLTDSTNNLRQEMTIMVSEQINNAMLDIQALLNSHLSQFNNINTSPALTSVNHLSPPQIQAVPIPPQSPEIQAPLHIARNFLLPSLSAANLAAIRGGKFVNFDSLLPASLSHTSSGYSLQFDSSTSDNPSVSLLPRSSRRTIRNFVTWLAAWNIFIQAFCFFNPSFAGSLLAYQSQISIYASRYDFTAWYTYDKHFRQNMANLHPNSQWADVDRHIFDEILLCASVLAICLSCREPGHHLSACPLNSSHSQQPFLVPQRAVPSSSSTQPIPPRSTSPSPITMACRYFNSGVCSFSNCKFGHVCQLCQGKHPAFRCPRSASK